MNENVIVIRLNQDDMRAIDLACASQRVTKTAFAREAIRAGLKALGHLPADTAKEASR